MQFEINFWRKFLAQFHSKCAELSAMCVYVCAGVGECLCLCVCAAVCVCGLRCFFPIGLRFAVAFSANHFNVIFYIISLIYQPLYLSLPPSSSLSHSSSLFLSFSFHSSCSLHFFVCANPLLTCKFIQLSWFSTMPLAQHSPPPSRLHPSATIAFFRPALKSPV